MKSVSLARLAEIAPNLGIFTLMDVFKEFGITLTWEIVPFGATKRSDNETKTNRSRAINAIPRKRATRGRRSRG